jgi:hypothetical protein
MRSQADGIVRGLFCRGTRIIVEDSIGAGICGAAIKIIFVEI